ncbi:hypothetical protein BAY61_03695 [Prauserella marina]|uniref:Uncharacterized protein n=1 Tax=Prauserella marina TaxID=530584 RepID=A0A222VKK8_9PSEU|nr:hypothetical protein [Prauserella marina]ASR34241.1 hypothetical protein BAY61_03695 [Prauserella marina]PWV71994.1 hypothetical protein DES30_111165 [Prauserella marina]SDD92771.1 hypothetical protein SAMN05421630_114164 [Prauserella marina]
MKRVPGVVWIGAACGLIAFLFVFTPWATSSAKAKAAAEGLRSGSVYAQRGAPDLVDAERAERIIGDRAIVVALFDEEPLTEFSGEDNPRRALCQDLASLVPSNLVVVFAADEDGEYGSSYCDGPSFPIEDNFSLKVIAGAEQSWKYRTTSTDLTPELEEYVLTFDVTAAEDHGEVPRRGPVPDAMAFGQLLMACAAMIAATVLLFLLLRQAAKALRRRQGKTGALRKRRKAIDARLSKVAERVLRPRDPECASNAKLAADYADALHRFREADTSQRLGVVEAKVTELENVIR